MGLHDWKNLDSEHFGDIDKIVEFCKQFHATSDDVLKAFKRKENINKEEAAALKNLDKFIIGLTLVELKKFLRFVTGSALKPKQILVEFSNDEHRPIKARTCSSLLYIPLNVKYNKFRRDFMKIISDEMNQDMTRKLSHDQQ
ncbi:hypothetical protein CAPTEDRAFT_216263 [Capitella teleta]|uniref:HECT domain-containing protein n=1 Tax=Capitella teleta TaxID=283909 RepID=R7UCA8_CAPTE|nr:hypothetical protein CAPTEDRAFT_216263 [Capitella teleta]|eukprot:ELU00897.1 hypothetical protein CAPTEDRAFT_216263 [Capitella teleta]